MGGVRPDERADRRSEAGSRRRHARPEPGHPRRRHVDRRALRLSRHDRRRAGDARRSVSEVSMDDVIYDRPRDYDLEHEHDDEDVAFHVELARRLAPRRVLELGAGSGRVTIPLAELGARAGFTVTALDVSETMLAEAEPKLAGPHPRVPD